MSDETDIMIWAESHAYYRDGFTGKHYSPFVCHIMNLLDKRVRDCNCVCEWASPYGWVPEAGCPKHDPDEDNTKQPQSGQAVAESEG